MLKLILDKIHELEEGCSRLYTIVYNMFDQFARPIGAAMPVIAEVLKSKRKIKIGLDPDFKERSWKKPCVDWLIELDDAGDDERLLSEMTRSQVADIIRRRQAFWRPPV